MNREDLLSAMYDDDDGNATERAVPLNNSDSRRIRVGIIEYEVPTIDYVRRLEQLIVQQAQMLEQQRRVIARVEGMLLGTRNFVRRHGETLNDLRFDMTHKVDHRA